MLEIYRDHPYFHVSSFQYTKLVIYTNIDPYHPIISQWGLIPHWVKDIRQKESIWNKTLNARGETIFEKPSFRQAAKTNRCLIYIDGFYEHHHLKGKMYSYYITRQDREPFVLAGLWSDWVDHESEEVLNTFSIVTTEGNSMMALIHNNPKLIGPRMPLILPEQLADHWLDPIEDDLDRKEIEELIQSYPEDQMQAHTVGKLRGKNAVGNTPEATRVVIYPELAQQDLF